jgi:hypothetical protein
MNHITTTGLLDHLKWRYATKQFDPTKTIGKSQIPQVRRLGRPLDMQVKIP